MAFDDLGRDSKDEKNRDRDRWIGVFIGALAVVLAICALGGGNASKEATLRNIEAANTWAFFQAKNMRRYLIRLQIDEMEIKLKTSPDLPEAARTEINAKIAEYRETEKRLTSEPDTGEGLDELFVKGKALEAERDTAMRQDPYFDYGLALLQIAIVLASISIISGSTGLLYASAGLGFVGALFTINGFLLLVALPLIG